MTTIAGFHPVTEVTADDRARIAFGKVGVHRNDRYAVSTSDSGEILLTPLATIPKRELFVWDRPELLASIMAGLEQADRGQTVEIDLGEDDED